MHPKRWAGSNLGAFRRHFSTAGSCLIFWPQSGDTYFTPSLTCCRLARCPQNVPRSVSSEWISLKQLSAHIHPLFQGDDKVLTFFDYLRQRAFESVLSGAQDALEFMEKQKVLHEPKRALPHLTQTLSDGRGPSSETKMTGQSDASSTNGDNDPLPAPRDHGRPRNHSKRRK